jgi:hypothetical protein
LWHEDGTFSREDFRFDEEPNIYICPADKMLTTTGHIGPDHAIRYQASRSDCGRACSNQNEGLSPGRVAARGTGDVGSWHSTVVRCGAASRPVLKVLRTRNDCAEFVSPRPKLEIQLLDRAIGFFRLARVLARNAIDQRTN